MVWPCGGQDCKCAGSGSVGTPKRWIDTEEGGLKKRLDARKAMIGVN